MTDEERAQAVVDNWFTVEGSSYTLAEWTSRGAIIRAIRQQFIEGLTAELIAVRAEERSKIANFIVDMGEYITGPELERARIKKLEEAIADAMTVVGRQVGCDSACDDPYCILARALGRNLPVAP